MRSIVERAIISSRQVDLEAREETVREHILRTLRVLRSSRPKATVNDVVERLHASFPTMRIVNELEKLRDEKLVELTPDEVAPDTLIRLVSPSARGSKRLL